MNLEKLIGTSQEVISFSGAVVKRKIQKDQYGFYVKHCGNPHNIEWDERFNKFSIKATLSSIIDERNKTEKQPTKKIEFKENIKTIKSEGELLKEYHETHGRIKHFKL